MPRLLYINDVGTQIAKGVKPTPAKTFETGHTQPVTEVFTPILLLSSTAAHTCLSDTGSSVVLYYLVLRATAANAQV
jgi:hypothetical protein